MPWIKRMDDTYIKFDELTKRSFIGARVEYVKNYTFLATVYLTNKNQSEVIVVGVNSYTTLQSAKKYCDTILKQIADKAKEMCDA